MTDHKTKLSKKLRSYRSAKIGSIFLAAVSALTLLMFASTGQTENESMVPAYASTFFWPAMAYICHLKMKLIRNELSELPDDAR